MAMKIGLTEARIQVREMNMNIVYSITLLTSNHVIVIWSNWIGSLLRVENFWPVLPTQHNYLNAKPTFL